MQLPTRLTAAQEDQLRSYLLQQAALAPPPAAFPRITPPTASTSEPFLPLRPPIPPAITPSPPVSNWPGYNPLPAMDVGASWNQTAPAPYASSAYLPATPTSTFPGSISLPGSFAPGLNAQVRDMHRQFMASTLAGDESIATAASVSVGPSTFRAVPDRYPTVPLTVPSSTIPLMVPYSSDPLQAP